MHCFKVFYRLGRLAAVSSALFSSLGFAAKEACLIAPGNAEVYVRSESGDVVANWQSFTLVRVVTMRRLALVKNLETGETGWVTRKVVQKAERCASPQDTPETPARPVEPQTPAVDEDVQDLAGCPADQSPAKLSPDCARQMIRSLAVKGRRTLGYDGARRVLFQSVDSYADSDGSKVVDSVYTDDVYSVGRGIPSAKEGVNTEHSLPRVTLRKHPRFGESEADLYHLFPCQVEANSLRSSRPFAECGNDGDILGGGDRTSRSCDAGFEPPEDHKGVLARAMFYMSIAYGIPLPDGEERVLRKWASEHPVTERELERLHRVQVAQGNVNPFILHPDWIDAIKNF